MPISDWKSWTLVDWNRALVHEVFFNSGQVDIPITRINASDRLLCKCIGIDEAHEEVRNHFVGCFGGYASAVTSKFIMRDSYKRQTQRDDIPVVFAHVFLTLLAGSADANSIGIGQFRLRFSELFKSFHIGELPFKDLPKFWSLIADWSLDRKNRHGDCRVLQLTYRGRETLIGNSKKLAFPTYSDERLLNSLLDPDNLDYGQVERKIRNNLNSFTDQFKEEFNDFFTCYHKSDLKGAFETPLWGVVQDLSLEFHRYLASNYGSFSVEIFIQQQQNSEFYLSTDENGYKHVKDFYNTTKSSSAQGEIFLIDLSQGKGLIRTLTDMASKYPDLRKMRLWKQLKNEFIPFFPDEGYLTTKGIFSDGDRCCFLMKNTLYEQLKHTKINFLKKPSLIKLSGYYFDWCLLYFEKIQFSELQNLLPEQLRRVVGVSWRPAQISLRDGAKYGQAYLINPSSNPRFESSKFSGGSYEISFYNNRIPIIGVLEEDQGFLRIPPLDISVDLQDINKITYQAIQLSGSGKVRKVISVVNRSPVPNNFNYKYSDKFVLPGRSGRLIPYRELFSFQLQDDAVGIRVIEYVKPIFSLSKEVRSLNLGKLVKISSSNTPTYLRWLSESLSLRFQSRSNLSYGELVTYTKDVAKILAIKHSRLRNLLFLGGWLLGLKDRNYQGFAPHLSPRTISVLKLDSLIQCRVVGLLNEAEENKILNILDSGESFYRLIDPVNILSIGAIEINLQDYDKVSQIISICNLLVLDQKSYGDPLSSRGVPILEAPLDSLPNQGGLTVFKSGEWVDYTPSLQLSNRMIIQQKETSKFWIFNGKKYLQADNELAIKFIQLVINGDALGTIDGNGECIFNSSIFSLPDSLTRWWLHWGGGCISYSDKGEITFAGNTEFKLWTYLRSWINDRSIESKFENLNYGLSRRRLALDKKFGTTNRRRYN